MKFFNRSRSSRRSNVSKSKRGATPSSRLLRLENLEDRALLSVTAGEYAQICAQYASLGLPSDPSTLNIIELDSDELSVNELKAAIGEATTSVENDLIVMRTTDAAHTITYASSNDSLNINFNASTYGSITIVSLGSQNLTLDANKLGRVVTINDFNSEVSFGGVNFINGITNDRGGGIYAVGTTTLVNCTIAKNTAKSTTSAVWGGGIYCKDTTTLFNCTISENEASSFSSVVRGGGILTDGTATLINCVIFGNSTFSNKYATYGGGVYALGKSTTLTNCTISGNTASTSASYQYVYGGGIYVNNATTVTNCTIVGNHATHGGSAINILNTSSSYMLNLYNSIVTQNVGDNIRGNIANSSNNIIGGDPSFVTPPTFDTNGVLTNADKYDLHLRKGSGAIDKGKNSFVSEVATDLGGGARVFNGVVDLGAYESVFVLNAPTNVRIVAVADSLVVSYDAVESATKYVVALSTDPNFATYESSELTDVFCPFDNLNSNTKYYVKVKATFDDVLDSAWTEVVSVKTLPDPKLTKVADMYDSVCNTDVDVPLSTWTTNDLDDPTYIFTIDGLETLAFQMEDGVLSYVGGLSSGFYTVDVTATDGDNFANASFELTVNNGKLDAPLNVEATGATPSSIAFTFDGVSYADAYVVMYSTDPEFATFETAECSDESGFFSGLASNTTYYFRVKATGDDLSDSAWSEPAFAKTEHGSTVTADEYAQIREQYASLELPEAMSDVNIIELKSDELSVVELKETIDEATTSVGNDLIVVRTTDAANTITYATPDDSLTIGFDASTYGSVTIVSLGTQNLTLDANKQNRVVTIDNSKSEVSFGGLNFVNGNVYGSDGGGGLYLRGKETLDRCTISGNVASFSDDSYSYGRGGGICTYDTTTLTNCTISGNTAYSEHNAIGGGIYAFHTTTLTNCMILDNIATSGFNSSGGGFFASNNSSTTIMSNCTVSGNVASVADTSSDSISSGGGIYAFYPIEASNCEISNNKARSGGGLYICDMATLTNCTIVGNQGDGILKDSAWDDTLNLYNSIVVQNIGSNLAGKTSDVLNSLIDVDPKDDPIFVTPPTFDENGVLTNADEYDLRLRKDSGAIDRGENSFVSEGATDLDGFARIVNDVVDIGAYEFLHVALDAPTNVSIESDFNSLVVSYDAVESATKYVVAYSTDSDFATYETAESTGVSCELGDLANNTTYYVRVKATANAFWDSEWSDSVFATTKVNLTADEYAPLRAQYSSLELPEAMSDVNIVELDSARLSVAKLQATVAAAVTSEGDDLIVVHTTDAFNTITYSSSDDCLSVGFDASTYGSVTIVSLGSQNLTLDANQLNRVFTINGAYSKVSFGGLNFVNGWTGANGGGIYSEGTTTFDSCAISGNTAISSRLTGEYAFGGGIYAIGPTTLTNSAVYGNAASSTTALGNSSVAYGGGIYSAAVMSLTNCAVYGNTASSSANSALNYNYASGGGIYVDGSATLTNCEISGNIASAPTNGFSVCEGYGGGIYASFRGVATLTNCTVAGNRSTTGGGGIRSGAELNLYNTLVVQNSQNIGGNISGEISAASQNNLLDVAPIDDSLFVTPPTFNGYGNLTNADEYDLRLREGCLAIDAGDNARVSEGATDLDGYARIYNGIVDIGAYEFPSEFVMLSVPKANKAGWATENSINVSYGDQDFVRGQDKYVVEYSKDSDFATIEGSKTFTQPGTVRVGNLDSGTTYYFRVKRVNADGESGGYSNVVSCKTLGKMHGVLVEAPTATKAGWATENSINVSYSDTNFVREQDKYVVEYSKDSDFATIQGSKTFTQPGTGRVGNLDSGTTYYFRVKHVNADGESGWSDVVSCKTLGVLVEAPTATKAGWATENSINISYSDTNFLRGQDKYVVEYSKDSDFATIEGSKTFTQPGTGRVGNLDSGTTYYFRVKRVNADSSSEWSNVVFTTTLDVVFVE